MSAILDAFPYPWSEPAAQQLHIVLANMFPDQPDAVNIAARAGMSPAKINARQAPTYVWMDILDLAGRTGATRSLVKTAHDLLNANDPQRPFLVGLIANATVSIDAEPRDAKGAPSFLTGSDDITEPEALLYYDDLTLQIGRVPGLIATLQHLVKLAPSVCRMYVDFNGGTKHGTGFRIGPDLLLTNWHVFHDTQTRTRATAVTAEFGYEDDGRGQPLTGTNIQCDVNTIVADSGDDWAVIRPGTDLNDAWPVVKLSESVAPVEGSATYIIQHPAGERKRIGFVRNQVASFDDRVVHYLTDTQAGSSGAPVFNADGKLIALHHAGGRPQQVIGKPPVKKNEGIRIGRVIAGLQANGITVA